MTPEHLVAGWNDGVVEFEAPLAIHRRELMDGERMVRLRGRSTDVRVTEGHGVVYKTGSHCAWQKLPARDRIGRGITLPGWGEAAPLDVELEPRKIWTQKALKKAISHTRWNVRHLEGRAEEEARSEAAWRVARKATLQHTPPEDLTLADCAFIGFWLGDGSAQRLQSGGVEYIVFESSRNAFIVEWLDGVIGDLGVHFIKRTLAPHEKTQEVKYRRTAPCYAWSFPRGTGGGSQARDGLYPIELYLKHEGSWLYWGLSDPQFEALLHGLWMSDGDHGRGAASLPHAVRIHNARKTLLDRIQAIAACRGYRTLLRPTKQEGMWRLSLIRRRHHSLSRTGLEYDDSAPRERVWCVTTSSGNIITRRNGCVVVLGNCEGWDQPSVKCAILARPTKSTGLYLQQAGRILRPCDAWNVAPAQFVDVNLTKRWTWRGNAFASGGVERAWTDISALGLEPLPLKDQGLTDISEIYEPILPPDPYAEMWAFFASTPRTAFTFDIIAWGAGVGVDSEDHNACLVADAAELMAFDHAEARELLMEALLADLRCIDAHVHLGNIAFDHRPQEALVHYEIAIAIGELSLSPDFSGMLPWGHIHNRPFLRALHGYGLCHWRLDRPRQAREVFDRILRLNPNDNQGVRFCWDDIRNGHPWRPEGIGEDHAPVEAVHVF